MHRPKHKCATPHVHLLNITDVDQVRIQCRAINVPPTDVHVSADDCVVFLIHTHPGTIDTILLGNGNAADSHQVLQPHVDVTCSSLST